MLNSVFLYHCTRAGLDAAIVNTQKLARYAEIPEQERALAETLIYPRARRRRRQRDGDRRVRRPLPRPQAPWTAQPRAELPLDERLARAVIEGSKEGLASDLDAALADERWPEPLDIINGPLMTGMAEVGRLFNDNQLIVAEVLAERRSDEGRGLVSRASIWIGSTGSSRGKILLATVKGDVHDIGKNLVDIILSNNGFEVVNLGIKVTERAADPGGVREHKPDLIGLSGLLVKSAQQMVLTAEDFAAVGHRYSVAGGWRRPDSPLHPPQDRSQVRGSVHLRQRRHARTVSGRAPDGR